MKELSEITVEEDSFLNRFAPVSIIFRTYSRTSWIPDRFSSALRTAIVRGSDPKISSFDARTLQMFFLMMRIRD